MIAVEVSEWEAPIMYKKLILVFRAPLSDESSLAEKSEWIRGSDNVKTKPREKQNAE